MPHMTSGRVCSVRVSGMARRVLLLDCDVGWSRQRSAVSFALRNGAVVVRGQNGWGRVGCMDLTACLCCQVGSETRMCCAWRIGVLCKV